MSLVPYVIEKTNEGERSYDIFSRLLKDRIVMLNGAVEEGTAAIICSQLLFLDAADPTKEIYFYINSPGGIVTEGLAIYDTIKYIRPDVVTICMGQAASMGSFLLAAGTKGKRQALPNSRIMIHQPSGGFQGQETDIQIHAKEIERLKKLLTNAIAENCGKDYDTVYAACERDYYMSAQEAKNFGLIDSVITTSKQS